MSSTVTLTRRLAAEGIGTALLLVAVVGSGIMGERLAQGNAAIALLANSIATGCALYVLVVIFGPLSGAHFNPVVTLSMALRRQLPWGDAGAYAAVQVAAAILGVVATHLMFGDPLLFASQHVRTGGAQWWSEFIATFGLLLLIWRCTQEKYPATSAVVAAYITGAYWFTSSTSFANPAVTIARSMTDTFAGIRPADAPGFIAAQIVGALAATVVAGWLGRER